jgi:hypothetical protein
MALINQLHPGCMREAVYDARVVLKSWVVSVSFNQGKKVSDVMQPVMN